MDHPLDGCRAKLDRAKEHLDALDREASEWGSLGLELLGETDEFGAPWTMFCVRLATPIPTRLGLLAGDALHNTRSALDHLACRLVELNGKKPDKQNSFPIYETRPTDQRKKARFKAALDGMRKSHADGIRALQPFERRGTDEARRLTLLAALDNLDKHQLVVATIGEIEHAPTFPQVRDATGPVEFVLPPNVPLYDGAIIARWRATSDATVHMRVRAVLAFGDRRATNDELEAIRAYVVGIVESFAPDFR